MCHQVSACLWRTLDECVLGSLGSDVLERRRQVPWQEILDVGDWMIGDASQHTAKVELRIEPVELRRSCRAPDYAE